MWEARGSVPGLPGYDYNSRLLVRKMPLMNFPRYIQTTPRDFFYLTERALLPGGTFLKDPKSQTDSWKPVALSGNEFPHAIMTTSWAPPDDSPLRVLRVDPKQLIVAKKTASPPRTVLIGFGQATASTDPNSTATPTTENNPVSLYFSRNKFVLAAEPPAESTFLVATQQEGRLALCVDEEGLLTAIGPFAKTMSKLPFDANCPTVSWLPGTDSMRVGESASDSEIILTRAKIRGAKLLYPETPIVPPTTWAIPQSKQAALVEH